MKPTFQRKQYQEMARVISSLDPLIRNVILPPFMATFRADNPNFDEFRFLRACTVVDFKEEA